MLKYDKISRMSRLLILRISPTLFHRECNSAESSWERGVGMPQSRRSRLRASFAVLAFALMLICSSMLAAGIPANRAYAQDAAQGAAATSAVGEDSAPHAEVGTTAAANEIAAVRPIADKTATAPADPTDYESWARSPCGLTRSSMPRSNRMPRAMPAPPTPM